MREFSTIVLADDDLGRLKDDCAAPPTLSES